ncbi:MAG: hypothetical protein M9933_16890 [Chitinophagaceae bacterium]|nr:hypothetical protein [Chitinophagaceae bacterium]
MEEKVGIDNLLMVFMNSGGCTHFYIQNQTQNQQMISISYYNDKQAERNIKRLNRFERYGTIDNLTKSVAKNNTTTLDFSLLSKKKMLLTPLLARLTIDSSLYPVICYPQYRETRLNTTVCHTADQLLTSSKEKFTFTTLLLRSTRVIYIE